MDSDEDEDHHGFVGFNAKTSSPDKMPAQGETLDLSFSVHAGGSERRGGDMGDRRAVQLL